MSKTSNQIPGSSSNKLSHPTPSNNRQRSDRPVPNSYVPTMNPHSLHSNSSKNIVPNISKNQPPQVSLPTSTSHKLLGHNNSEIHTKERSRNSMLNSNQLQVHSHKSDQRNLLKDSGGTKNEYNKIPGTDIKSGLMKTEGSYSSNNRLEQSKNVAKSQSHPQYSSSSSAGGHHMHRMDQQHVNHKLPSTDSFKLVDDTNRIMEPIQMSSPPKQSKPTSIFSPDWKDTTSTNVQANITTSRSMISTSIKSEIDSPTNKKHHTYERKPETPKKEKKYDPNGPRVCSNSNDKRIPSSGNGVNGSNNKKSSANDMNNPYDTMNTKKLFNSASLKRPFSEISSFKDDPLDNRDFKMPKIDYEMMMGLSPKSCNDNSSKYLNQNTNSNQSSSSYDNLFSSDSKNPKNFLNTVNGIETNPVLVSSLLKEICTDNKYGTSLNPPSPIPTISATVIPTATNSNTLVMNKPHNSIINTVSMSVPIKTEVKEENIILPEVNLVNATTISMTPVKQESSAEEYHKSKSDKKKKKEKHKNKDKERTKDREDRKKHKKDKDRHKERHETKSPLSESSVDHSIPSDGRIKITIPKEKLTLPAPDMNLTSSFKIKIPKDRIKTELPTGNINTNYYSSNDAQYVLPQQPQQQQPIPTNSLKIKISKDMIDNYSSSTSHTNESAIIHHSAKKKDRDKERERSNKSSKTDLSKSYNVNGNNNNGGNPGNGSAGGSSGQSMNRNSSSNPNQKVCFAFIYCFIIHAYYRHILFL